MNGKEMIKELEGILEISEGCLNPDGELVNIEEWDSMSKLSFMAYARKEFGKRVTVEELNAFKTVQDLCDYLLEEK